MMGNQSEEKGKHGKYQFGYESIGYPVGEYMEVAWNLGYSPPLILNPPSNF